MKCRTGQHEWRDRRDAERCCDPQWTLLFWTCVRDGQPLWGFKWMRGADLERGVFVSEATALPLLGRRLDYVRVQIEA